MVSSQKYSSVNSAQFRLQRLKYAAVSSIGSKVVTLVSQFIALPLAARSLGQEQFALYSVLVATTAWVSFANLGVSPALITGIADAEARQDRLYQSWLLTSALLPIIVIAGLLIVVNSVLMSLFPVWDVIGSGFERYKDVVTLNISILVLTAALKAVLSVPEAAQAGFQEVYFANIRTMLGGMCSIVAVLIVTYLSPTVTGLVLAVSIPSVIAQLLNVLLFLIKRPYLIPTVGKFRGSIFRSLLTSSVLFAVAGTLGAFLNHQLPTVIISKTASAEATATFAAYINLFTMLLGLVSMLSVPLWSALSDSIASSDWKWAQRAYRNFTLYSMLYAVSVAGFLIVFGDRVMGMLFGNIIHTNTAFIVGFALYFVVDVWEYTHYMVLIGINKIRVASAIYCVRSLLFMLLASQLAPLVGSTGIVWCLIVSVSLVTLWSFPLLTIHFIAREK